MRRNLKFSVRTLLVLVAVVCAWLGWANHKYRVQQRAIHAVQALGGDVAWKTTSPQWLVNLIGRDPFAYVSEVSFIDAPIRGDDLTALAGLTRLEQLSIAQSASFTGQGLQHLAGLDHLRIIYFYDVPITDEGLLQLPPLPELEQLYVLGTRITDECLPLVERRSQLQVIQLGGSELLTKSAVHELDQKMPACQVSWSGQGYSAD